MQRKVGFFVVGVQKAGANALHGVLSRNSGICMPVGKELHFFDDETRDWSAPEYDHLHAAFCRTTTVRSWARPRRSTFTGPELGNA